MEVRRTLRKAAKPAPKAKRTIDWERIRAEYEVGGPDNSVRSIASRHGISHTAINRRIKVEGWPEPGDLDEAIRQQVSAKVSGIGSSGNPKKRAEAIDAEADKRAAVVQRHRVEWEEIEQLRREVLDARLEPESAGDGEAEEEPGDGKDKKKDKDELSPTAKAFEKAKLLKIMSEATAIKQAAQRKAYALDAKGTPNPGDKAVTTFRIAPLE